MKNEISNGIETLRNKYGFSSFHAFSIACGFKSKATLVGVYDRGNVTFKTLAQIGTGLGFEGDSFEKVMRVLKEMKGDE